MFLFSLQLSGHTIDSSVLDRMQLGECRQLLTDIAPRFRDLNFDRTEYTCIKFLILLNPGTFDPLPLPLKQPQHTPVLAKLQST